MMIFLKPSGLMLMCNKHIVGKPLAQLLIGSTGAQAKLNQPSAGISNRRKDSAPHPSVALPGGQSDSLCTYYTNGFNAGYNAYQY
ncbi:jg6955 [Pararge aegeria aegeria]|uniref:Jg6955 protein n=1 Tax=Pararge aegeria aegeria TaxID=348720 RepID=A0A8S4SPA3_9NEOP|nr:jg6955 [Pararge aegeria aegeria]